MPALGYHPTTVNDVIYARVPPALKQDVQAYAQTVGLSVNSAVASLLEAGLSAAAQSGEELTDEIRAKELQIAELRSVLADRDTSLRGLEQQRADLTAAVEGLAGRLERAVGRCPSCHKSVTGTNVLIDGSCASCGRSLSSLLAEDRAQLNQNDYLVLVGALGVLLALAMWQSRQP